MANTEYANITVTEDGYGIHTFELKILHLTNDQRKELKERFKAFGSFMDEEKECLIVTTEKALGVRIILHGHKSSFPYLSLIVNPWILLNNKTDYTKILFYFDASELKHSLNFIVKYYLGDNFSLKNFQLTRIDCTVNLRLKSHDMTVQYIDLIRRSVHSTA